MPNCTKKKVLCAICSQPGQIECKYCHYAVYCCDKHRITDWNAIHKDVCGRLKQIHKIMPIFVTDIERQQHKERLISLRHDVLNVCKENGNRMLFQKNYKQALPVIMQELRWVTEIYGATSPEIIPTYCRIIEGCLGNKRLEQAEDYMSQALWCLQKVEVTNAVKFSLFKVLGRICEAKDQVEESRDALAEHLYYAAEQWGPESIQTMWGYLHLGLSFLDKAPAAYSFFAKVIKVANQHLTPITTAYVEKNDMEEFNYVIEEGSHSCIHYFLMGAFKKLKLIVSEQLEMVITVRSFMEKICRKYITIFEVTELFLVLGILHHFCATDKATPYLDQVIEIAEKLKNFEPTIALVKKLQTKEQLRLREWLRTKMTDAQTWEGLPGTWHDIDAEFDRSKESHGEMLTFYNQIDANSNQAKQELEPLAATAQTDIHNPDKREAAGRDTVPRWTSAPAAEPPDSDASTSDEEIGAAMPTKSLSGSAQTPVSLYYLSYIK